MSEVKINKHAKILQMSFDDISRSRMGEKIQFMLANEVLPKAWLKEFSVEMQERYRVL